MEWQINIGTIQRNQMSEHPIPPPRYCFKLNEAHWTQFPNCEPGTKKVQQVLSNPNELEKWVTTEEATLLRSSFAGQYSLAEGDSPDEVSTIM